MKKLLFLIIALFATNLAFGQFSTDVSVSGLTPATGPMCDGLYPVTILVTNMDPVQPTNGPVPVLYSLDGTLVSTVFTSGPLAGGASELVTLGMFGNKPGKHRITVGANYAGDLNPMNNVGDNYVTVQFNGTYSVGALPTDHFSSLKMAVDTINFYGLCGPTIINCQPGHTETNSEIVLNTTTSNIVNTLVFNGNNAVITAGIGTGTTDGIIKIAGSDWVTFNGFILNESAGNTTSAMQMEWGIALVKTSATNGAQYNTIRNCVITLNKANTSSIGIYGGNHLYNLTTAITVTSIDGTNSYNKIFNNTVSNVYGGISLAGFNASTPYTLYDQGNEIGKGGANIISNYGGGGSSARGLYMIYQNLFTLANNNFSNATTVAATLYGIFVSTCTNSSYDIYGNKASFQNTTVSSTTYGIAFGNASTGTTNTINVYGNKISGCRLPNAVAAIFYGIYCNTGAQLLNVYKDTVIDNSNKSATATGVMYGIYNATSGVITLNIDSCLVKNDTLAGTGSFYGISTIGVAGNTYNIFDNDVFNCIKTGTTGTGTLYGIQMGTGTVTAHHNKIHDLTISGGTGTLYGLYDVASPTIENYNNNEVYNLNHLGTGNIGGLAFNTTSGTRLCFNNTVYGLSGSGGIVYGISFTTSSTTAYKNRVYNLSSTTSAGLVRGIYVASLGTAGYCYIYNNYISDLRTPNSTTASASVAGIYSAATTASSNLGIYYNSVYLAGTSDGANFGSAALFLTGSATATTVAADVRNNIFVNNSTPVGTGLAIGHQRSSINLENFGAASNYNDFYCGTPSSKRLIFYDGTNSDSTIAQYQTRVTTRDAASFSVMPPFVNIAATPYDLHLQTSVSTMCESGGIRITSPIGITDDFDANLRQGETGYAGAGSAPDVGADEIEGMPSFTCVAPVPGNTLSTSNPVCNGQNIILSLQTPGSGTGLSYQWQDSPDGSIFTNISGAVNSTYSYTPTISGLYYQCVVTCQNGPSTGTSNPIQITFTNSITGTTPATRCGTGTVLLSATGSAGTTMNWYTAVTGGTIIGTGTSFTTPSLSATTTYYVGAETSVVGTVAVGAGAGTTSTYSNPFYSDWSNNHTQHLITKDELLAAGVRAGNITSVALDVTSAGTLPMIDLAVKIGATATTTMTAFADNSGFLTVYTNASLMPTAGVNTLTFVTPFNWDGNSNIILEFCHGNGSSSATMSRTVRSDATSYVSTVKAHVSAATAAAVICPNTTTNLVSYSLRPKFLFNGQTVCSSPRSSVVATVTAPPAITPSATPAAICLGDASALNVTSPNDPNYTYTWMPGSLTGAAQSVSPAATTTYTVTAIDNSGGANDGCVTAATIGVSVNPLPPAVVVTPSADTLCQNAVLQLNATGGSVIGSGVIGTATTSSTTTTPFRGFYGGSKVQTLFTAAELSALGMSAGYSINQISLGFATFTSPYTFNGFTVGMKNTASTVLTTTIETGLTEVIAPSAFTLTGTAPFTQSLALSTPFVWDGTSNLLIETCFNNNDGGGAAGNSAAVYYTATGTNLTCYYSADNTATVCSAPGAASTSTSRPNIGFDFSLLGPITWAPLTDLYTDAGATIAYTGTPATSVYTMPTANRTYTATATTGAGCTATATSVITHDDLAISLVTATDITCNGLGNGSITVTTTGGFAPIQYSIDGGGSWQASNSFTSLIAGSYTVSVKDLNNCVVNYASNPVVIVEPAAVAISSVIKTDLTTCAGTDGTITISATGGTGAYSYSIDNGGSWQGSGTYTGLPAGSYNVQVKDVNNCTVIYTSNPVVIATPIAVVIDNVTNDNNSCFNSDDAHIIITASAGTAPYQYSIDGGVSYFSNGGTFNNLAPGTYNVFVRDNSSCIAVYASNPIVITEPDVLDITLTATDVLCNGGATGTATAVVTGGTTPYDYTWAPSGGTNAAATGLIAGTYTVTVGDDNGCTLSESIIVNEPSVLAITGVTPVNLLCFNGTDGSITIAATGGTPVLQYSIDNGANWQLSNAFTGLIAGSYTVIVKDNNNCQVAYVSNPVVLTQPGSGVDITNVASTSNICFGGNAGTITVTASGGVAPLMYSINNGGSWQLSNSFSGLIAGNYTIVVKDDNNCQLAYTSNPVIITEPGVIDITSVVVTAPSCNGTADASITIVATGGTGILQYSINNGTTYQTSNIFSGLIAGSYTILVEDANLCEVAYTSNPLIIADPAAVAISNVASVNVLCFGNNTGSITVTANGGSTPLLYSIDNGTTFQTSNVFSSLIAGSYNLIVKDSNDCSLNYASNPIVITEPAAALAISNLVATNVGCSGGNNGGIVITATGGTTTYQYSVNNGTTWQTSGTYSTLIAGSYTVLVKDANNCQVAYASNPVIITQPATSVGISGVVSTNVLCLGNSDATITITATGGTPSYQYSIDNGSNYQASNTFTGLGTGSYTIRIKDANNCTVAYASNPVVITEPATAVSIASAVGTDLNCNGGLSGIITVTASGGTGVLQYSADNGTTWTSSNVITGLAAGTHNIWVRDANLCTAAYSGNPVTLLEPNPIIITGFSSTNVLCHGSTDGSIEVYAIGGTGALQYSIDSGATWQPAFAFNGLAAGNYDVMALDANNCIVAFGTNPVVITEPASISITNVVTVKNLCNGDNNASIEITATGGTGALEYTINNGLSWTSTGLFTGLTAGSYTIRVRDENYCVYNYSANPLVLVDPPAIVINNVDSTDITTYGGSDGTIQIVAYGGTGPLQYSVDNGASWQFGNTFGGLIAGGYFLWVQDENGCMAQYWSNPVILTQPSGIDENGNMPGVMIYPDPSQGEITIEAFNMTDLQKIEITTIEGKVLDIITGETFVANNMKMKYEFAADVKGMYFVRLTTGDKVYVKKIVVN